MTKIEIDITRTRTLTESGRIEAEVPDEIVGDDVKIHEYVEANPEIFITIEIERQLNIDEEQIEYDEVIQAEES